MTVKAELYFFDRYLGQSIPKPRSIYSYKETEYSSGGYVDVKKTLGITSTDALAIQTQGKDEIEMLEKDEINRAQIVIPSRVPGFKRMLRWESDGEEPVQTPSEDYPHINPEDRKPTFSQRLMKIAEDWEKEKSGEDLKLFIIRNVYSAEEPTKLNIRLSPAVLFGLMDEGLTLRERLDILHIPDGVLEGEIASFLRDITSKDVPLRLPKWHRNPNSFATKLKGVTLHSEPLDSTRIDFYLHLHRKAR